MKKLLRKENLLEWTLVLVFFLVTFAWAMTAGEQGGPDEGMRYLVAKYLYKNPGSLPRGDDPAIMNSRWGLSYGFYPILSYMVSVVFMWVTGIFTTDKMDLLRAARMADVLFMTVAAWLTLRIGRRLFKTTGKSGEGDERRWFFSILVIFLPGFIFLGTYVNTDSLALMAAAMILLAWVRYLDEGWTWKNCVLLAVGMGICLLSYYNAYGWILWSFVFFCVTILVCGDCVRNGADLSGNGTSVCGSGSSGKMPMAERWKFLFSRGIVIAVITLGISGWWFIRNYILYEGDILGRKASTLCAEKNAWDDFKPSVHMTPSRMGWSWKQFFLYQDPGWPHNWVIMVLVSFVGTFGYFHIFMNETVSKVYLLFLFAGAFGMFFALRQFCLKTYGVTNASGAMAAGSKETSKRRGNAGVSKAVANKASDECKAVHGKKEWSPAGIFNLTMLATLLTPVILFISYAYNNDNQAQGRYIMCAVYPIMYFVTCGYDALLKKLVKNETIRKWFYRVTSVLWIIGAVLTYLLLIIPAYK